MLFWTTERHHNRTNKEPRLWCSRSQFKSGLGRPPTGSVFLSQTSVHSSFFESQNNKVAKGGGWVTPFTLCDQDTEGYNRLSLYGHKARGNFFLLNSLSGSFNGQNLDPRNIYFHMLCEYTWGAVISIQRNSQNGLYRLEKSATFCLNCKTWYPNREHKFRNNQSQINSYTVIQVVCCYYASTRKKTKTGTELVKKLERQQYIAEMLEINGRVYKYV